MSKDCQDNGIIFGDWKLVPVDARNWELCHRHAVSDTPTARKAGTVGVVQWNRLGRFYQFNTFNLALRYAADRELKDEAHGRVMALEDAIIGRSLFDADQWLDAVRYGMELARHGYTSVGWELEEDNG